MYDFKQYNAPNRRKKKTVFYGFFSFLFILIIIIFTFKSIKPYAAGSVSTSNLTSVENKFIIDGVKMVDDSAPLESEGEIIFDDSFDDDIDISKIIKIDSDGNKEKKSRFNIDDLKKKDKRWHLTQYTVKKNDTIWKISKKFNVDFRLIILANNMDNPDILKPGKIIMIPNRKGVFHTVKKGESLSQIALLYNVSSKNIGKHNRVHNANVIKDGQTLFIPGAVEINRANDLPIARKKDVNVESRVNNSGLSLLWPVDGRITSGFGDRKNPVGKGRQFHCGLDISCPVGTPIKAALDGSVIFSGWKEGYGNLVILRHERGYITVYGHNSENVVNEGDSVMKGQVIAKSGMTGSVTGPHLHFEVRRYLTPLNPLRFLKERQ